MMHKNAYLAIIAVLLAFSLLNPAFGQEREKVEDKHYNNSGELVHCAVRDVIYGSRKTYLTASQVAEIIETEVKLKGRIRINEWRIEQETFRKFYDEFKKYEAIFLELKVDRATNADIQKISELSNIEKLVLDDCQADDFLPLVKLKKLESLSIHNPNMKQLRDEKILQQMENLKVLELISVPSIQEAIDLPLPPVVSQPAQAFDKGLRSISIYAPTFDEKPVIIPEELKQLHLSFACGKKGYVRLSKWGIKAIARDPEASKELNDNLKKLVYHSGLMENHAIAYMKRLTFDGTHRDVKIDVSPLNAFSNLEHLTISSGESKYTGFANLDNVPLESIWFETMEPYGPSEKNVKNLKLHPTLAVLEHNFYSASSFYPINRLRINALPAETEEGKSLPANTVALELVQPCEVNAEPYVSPGVYCFNPQRYSYWLGVQGNRKAVSEITCKYDPKKTKNPDIGLFLWTDPKKKELSGRKEYRKFGATLNAGKQKYSESVWHFVSMMKGGHGKPVLTRTIYAEGLSPGDYEIRWMVGRSGLGSFIEEKSDKITIRVEERNGKLYARALPKTGKVPEIERKIEEVEADVARFPVVPVAVAVAVLVVFAGSFFYCRRYRQSPKQSDK